MTTTPPTFSIRYRDSSEPTQKKRRLFTPRTKTTLQLANASKKTADLNRTLKHLQQKKTTAAKKKRSMDEYRCQLKIATVESVKCMYEEYMRRKRIQLSGQKAEVLFNNIDMEQFCTPPRSTSGHEHSWRREGWDESNSPLATPLE